MNARRAKRERIRHNFSHNLLYGAYTQMLKTAGNVHVFIIRDVIIDYSRRYSLDA